MHQQQKTNFPLYFHCQQKLDNIMSFQPPNSSSLCSNSHRCHISLGGGCRAEATATDPWVWWFRGQKITLLCACQAHCLSLPYARGRNWRESRREISIVCCWLLRTTMHPWRLLPIYLFQDCYLKSWEAGGGFWSPGSMAVTAFQEF